MRHVLMMIVLCGSLLGCVPHNKSNDAVMALLKIQAESTLELAEKVLILSNQVLELQEIVIDLEARAGL